MDRKKIKSLYMLMRDDNMLPKSFTKVWNKDKTAFTNWIELDEKIGIHYDEVVIDKDDDYEQDWY